MNTTTLKIIVFFASVIAGAAAVTAVRAHADTAATQLAGAIVGVSPPLLKPTPKPATIVLSGFSKQRINGALYKTEEVMFNGHIGSIEATCGGSAMRVSQVLPLYKVNALLVRECPSRGLRVTFTSHRPTPPLTNAAILKHP